MTVAASSKINLSGSARTLAKKINQNKVRNFAPPSTLLPSEWAEKNIRIPAGNAIPGLIRFDNAPYQREPLDMSVNPDCHRITLMWGAQLGKTQLVTCKQGFFIAERPQSQMMMQPSQGDLQTWLETKFNPAVAANEVLANRIAKPRGRDGVNNQKMKSYPGGFLMFAWAGSSKTMRGRSAPKIDCDEVDGYESTAEGHPVNLLWQRAATFADQRLLMETSTPTVAGQSFIEDSFEAGDQRRFRVPCPHCNERITFEWSQVLWDKNEAGEHLPETSYYACQECGGVITDGDKRKMLRHGEWVADKPFRGHASYHLSELYSGFRRWRDIAVSFLEKKAQNDLRSFVNVSLAETWKEKGEAPEWKRLYDRREDYQQDMVPSDKIVAITAGADVQKNRIECEIVGWGANRESWSIGYRIFHGETDTPDGEAWQQLDKLLSEQYPNPHGILMPIDALAVDAGYNTNTVYTWAKRYPSSRVIAVMGEDNLKAILGMPKQTELSRGGKRLSRGATKWGVGSSVLKAELYGFLNQESPVDGEPFPYGYCHFPQYDAEFFKMITAEELRTKTVKGYQVQFWEKIRDRNESLDCRNYARAAACHIGLDRWSLDKINAMRSLLVKGEEVDEIVDQVATAGEVKKKSRGLKRRKSNYL